MPVPKAVKKMNGYPFLPNDLREQKKLRRRLALLQEKGRNLQEVVFYKIISGESTGDIMADFAIVSCLGIADEDVMNSYKRLQEDMDRCAGHYMLIVQKAEYSNGSETVILRNISLAVADSGAIEFNITKGHMTLPVRQGYVVFREMADNESDLMARWLFVSGASLFTGPLENQFCEIGKAKRPIGESDTIHVPIHAPCCVFFQPWDKERLFDRCGIDEELLSILIKWFIRKKSAKKI
jgi:hypothetical protein